MLDLPLDKSWINWYKNAKICPRCKQRVTVIPCPECGFEYSHKASQTKPQNLEVQTEGELEEVTKILPAILPALSGIVSSIADSGSGNDDEEEDDLAKAINRLDDILKREGGESIGKPNTGGGSKSVQSNGRERGLSSNRMPLTIPKVTRQGKKFTFNPAGHGQSGDVLRGTETNVRGTLPATSRGTTSAKEQKNEWGSGSKHIPKYSPTTNIQNKKTPRAATGAMGTENRNIPTSKPTTSEKPRSILQRIRDRLKKFSRAPVDLGDITTEQEEQANAEFAKDPFHKGGKSPIQHTPTGKVRQPRKPPKYTSSNPHPQKRIGSRSGKNPNIFRRKDGSGYGNLFVTNVISDGIVDDDTFVGKPVEDPTKHETYIYDKRRKKQDE
jgi:hypothetical protein